MGRYVAFRIAQGVVVLAFVTLVTFAMQGALPGGPARAILGPRATPAQVQAFNQAHGLDKSVPVQFADYIGNLLRGNLGFSYKLNQSVAALIVERLPKTLLLTGTSLVLALVIGIPLGLFQGNARNSAFDYSLTGVTFTFYAMPIFFLSLLLVLGFAIYIPIFPPEAPQGGTVSALLAQPLGIVLPITALTLWTIALFSRYMRSSVIENLTQDYVRTARSKGLGNAEVLRRHVLRNSSLPIVTLVGLMIPQVVAGALIVEAVFNYPGMGLLFWNAATAEDFPVELGVVLVTAVATIVGSLLADIAYAALDPRVRYR